MAALVFVIVAWVKWLFAGLTCWWGLWECKLFNLGYDFLNALVSAAIAVASLVPVPSEVANWSWPDAGPLVGVLGEVGFAQATAIVAGAMTIKFMLRLIPFVRL